MIAGFAVLGGILWLAPWVKQQEMAALAWSGSRVQVAAVCLWALGLVLLGVSRGPHALARAVYVGWMSVAVLLGIVMTTILLTAIFIVVLPLFSVVVRLGDPLRKKLTNDDTYWEDYRPYEPTMERMRRPF